MKAWWLAPLGRSEPVVIALTYGALLALCQKAGLLGIWLAVLVFFSLYRYCYELLRFMAQGRSRMPPPDLGSMNPLGEWTLVGHGFLYWGLFFWLNLVDFFSGGGPLFLAATVVALCLVALFPASAALVGLTGNLPVALSPNRVLSIIRRMGTSYIALLAACAVVFGLATLAQFLALRGFGLFSLLASNGLFIWGLLLTFALTGSAIRHHRDDFEIPGEVESREERIARQMAEDKQHLWQKELDRIYGCLRTGNVHEGYEMLRNFIASEPEPLPLLRWLFENALVWDDQTHAAQIGKRLIETLVEAHQPHEALDVFKRCRPLETGVQLPVGTAAKLRDYASSIGQHGLADDVHSAANGRQA